MEAYWWLRDHTPEDSRVMAWWADAPGDHAPGDGGRQTRAVATHPNPSPNPNPNPDQVGLRLPDQRGR
jgi:hypothetical protein